MVIVEIKEPYWQNWHQAKLEQQAKEDAEEEERECLETEKAPATGEQK